MDEYQQLNIRRFMELADRSEQNSVFTYSGFHSVRTASLAYMVAPEGSVALKGGMDNAERVIVRFGDPAELCYEEEAPIKILHISPKQMKFADRLTHRDFLGAILNLGIERDMLGDILVENSSAYCFVMEKVADLLCAELDRIKHTAVVCRIADDLPQEVLPKLIGTDITLSSPRLDAVLAKVYHVSRADAKSLFDEEKVTVNGRSCTSPETVLKAGSSVSVRGYGRFEYRGEEKLTKKGKTGIRIWRFV